jgi:hypothetical protein
MEPVDYYKVSKLAKVAEGSREAYQHLGNWYRQSWRFIEKGDTGDWLPGLMIVNVVAACGVAGCRWK